MKFVTRLRAEADNGAFVGTVGGRIESKLALITRAASEWKFIGRYIACGRLLI